MGATLLRGFADFFNLLSATGVIRGGIVAMVLWGSWLGLARAKLQESARLRTWLALAVPLVAWFVGTWVLAAAGAFVTSPGLPAIPLAVVLPLALSLPLLLRSERIGAVLDALPAHWLVGLQVYRVLGLAFLVQWGLGNLSAAFALPAGIGDFLVGVLALPTALALRRGAPFARAIAWNLLGTFDLLTALTLGTLSANGVLPASPIVYPLVLIPTFAVPLSILLHAVSLRQLRRRSQLSSSEILPPLGATAAE